MPVLLVREHRQGPRLCYRSALPDLPQDLERTKVTAPLTQEQFDHWCELNGRPWRWMHDALDDDLEAARRWVAEQKEGEK